MQLDPREMFEMITRTTVIFRSAPRRVEVPTDKEIDELLDPPTPRSWASEIAELDARRVRIAGVFQAGARRALADFKESHPELRPDERALILKTQIIEALRPYGLYTWEATDDRYGDDPVVLGFYAIARTTATGMRGERAFLKADDMLLELLEEFEWADRLPPVI